MTVEQLRDFDSFFYYGNFSIDDENELDLYCGLTTPLRSGYYNRNEGITPRDNFPNAFSLQFRMRYDIVNYVGYRNSQVTDGTIGKDRRVAVSQNSIDFDTDNNDGNVNVMVYYISLGNQTQLQNISVR